MQRRLAAGVFGIVMVGFAVPAFGQDLERAVAAAEALGARTGVVVCDAQEHLLYRHRALEVFAPASNMKLLTAAAVLSGLGSGFEFVTRFEVRDGRLIVTASGDPNWVHDSAHAPETVFAAVAAQLRRRGLRSLRSIELDAGTFTGPTRPSTWPQDQLYTYYCAPTGPFVLEQGTFLLRIASAGGASASTRLLAPLDVLPVEGSIQLVDSAKGATYGALDRGDRVQVRGRFPRRGVPVEIRTAMDEPTAWYRATLEHALRTAGIDVVADALVDATANGVVYEHRSALHAAVLRMLEESSNFDAEQCLRVLGNQQQGDGSLAGGMAAMQAQVAKLVGRVAADVQLVDGSGLSKQNRVSPGLLLVALVKASGGPGGAVLRECLPVAGKSGTLADRFEGSDLVGRVHAKTGWIRGASALTGMVEQKGGGVRWFSILMNYDPQQNGLNKDLKALQERMVQAIDTMDASR